MSSYFSDSRPVTTPLAIALGLVVLAHPAISSAQAAPPAPDPVSLSGYLDVSYNHLSGDNLFTSGVPARVFDLQRNGWKVQQAAVTVSSQPKRGFGGLLNLTAGSDANVITAYGESSGLSFDATQMFLQYSKGSATLTFGKFVTLAGEEVIASPSNWNFSRSILFGYAIPYTHTGLRLSVSPSAKVSYLIGVNNGWDDASDTNDAKTVEGQVVINATDKLSISAQGYFGKEKVLGLTHAGPEGDRNLLDLVATYKISSKTTAVLNYDTATQANASSVAVSGADKAKWTGFAAYVSHQVNDKWRATLRAEAFDDHDGYRTGVVQKWSESTLTLAYTPKADTEVRLEGRSDHSNVASFLDSNGNGSKTLNSLGVQFLLKF